MAAPNGEAADACECCSQSYPGNCCIGHNRPFVKLTFNGIAAPPPCYEPVNCFMPTVGCPGHYVYITGNYNFSIKVPFDNDGCFRSVQHQVGLYTSCTSNPPCCTHNHPHPSCTTFVGGWVHLNSSGPKWTVAATIGFFAGGYFFTGQNFIPEPGPCLLPMTLNNTQVWNLCPFGQPPQFFTWGGQCLLEFSN